MTGAQRRLRELRDRQSRERGRMAELAFVDELSDEQRSELDAIERGTPDLERQIRAATVALEEEEREQETKQTVEPDAEMRERIELRSKARLTNFVLCRLDGRLVTGAEHELAAAAGIEPGAIPLELFDTAPERRIEQRADTVSPAPSTDTGVNLQPIFPQVFARAVLPRCGVAMPRTASGGFSTATITSGINAAAKAKGAAAESNAATLTPKSTVPHRISARMSVAVEDVALIGTANFEARIREAAMLGLSGELDEMGLTGDPSTTAEEPQGLLSQLTDPTDPSDVIDFDGFAKLAADGIDGGPWAETLGHVRLLVNADTMRKAETTFQSATNYKGEKSAGSYLREKTGMFFSSARMPDTASTIAQVLRMRMNTRGLDGVNAGTLATCPVWNQLSIDDIYSSSTAGIRHFTLHALVGDVLIIQASAFERIDVKLST